MCKVWSCHQFTILASNGELGYVTTNVCPSGLTYVCSFFAGQDVALLMVAMYACISFDTGLSNVSLHA